MTLLNKRFCDAAFSCPLLRGVLGSEAQVLTAQSLHTLAHVSPEERHLIGLHERELKVLAECLGLPAEAVLQFVQLALGDAHAVAAVSSRCLHLPVEAVTLFLAGVMDATAVRFRGDLQCVRADGACVRVCVCVCVCVWRGGGRGYVSRSLCAASRACVSSLWRRRMDIRVTCCASARSSS